MERESTGTDECRPDPTVPKQTFGGIPGARPCRRTQNGPGRRCPGPFRPSFRVDPAYAVIAAVSLAATTSGASAPSSGSSASGPNATSLYR
jgi:hypothetical protein